MISMASSCRKSMGARRRFRCVTGAIHVDCVAVPLGAFLLAGFVASRFQVPFVVPRTLMEVELPCLALREIQNGNRFQAWSKRRSVQEATSCRVVAQEAPPAVDEAMVVPEREKEWSECLIEYGVASADQNLPQTSEVWVFRKKDYSEFERLLHLRTRGEVRDGAPAVPRRETNPFRPVHAATQSLRWRGDEIIHVPGLEGLSVYCHDRDVDAELVCTECVHVLTGGAYENSGVAVPAYPPRPAILNCLALSRRFPWNCLRIGARPCWRGICQSRQIWSIQHFARL